MPRPSRLTLGFVVVGFFIAGVLMISVITSLAFVFFGKRHPPEATGEKSGQELSAIAEQRAAWERQATRHQAAELTAQRELVAAKASLEVERKARDAAERESNRKVGTDALGVVSFKALFVGSLAPEVVSGQSRHYFLERNPDAELVTDNRAENFMEYSLKTGLGGQHLVFIRDVLVLKRFHVVCPTKSDAEFHMKKLADRLGKPDSETIPPSEAAERKMILRHLWTFKEFDYSVSGAILTGSTKAGATIFFYEQTVANMKGLKP